MIPRQRLSRERGRRAPGLEQQVLDAARAGGVRIIGPNTSGMFNLHPQVEPASTCATPGPATSASSRSRQHAAGAGAGGRAQRPRGFSTYVGPGNQTDVGFNDYLRYLGEDAHTRVATLYVEGFRDGQRFLEVAREITPVKPVVVYKSGATEFGKKAASSTPARSPAATR